MLLRKYAHAAKSDVDAAVGASLTVARSLIHSLSLSQYSASDGEGGVQTANSVARQTKLLIPQSVQIKNNKTNLNNKTIIQ